MIHTRWTNEKINAALAQLGAHVDPTPAQAALFTARVRREVEARFGVRAWQQPLQRMTDVHTAPVPTFGIMDAVFGFVTKPAFALAAFVLVLAGTFAFLRDHDRASVIANRAPAPQTSSAVAVLEDTSVEAGTGFAMSVFGEALALAPATMSGTAPLPQVPAVPRATRPSTIRRAPAPAINPAPGVFSRWGTSVFSSDEALTRPWDGGGKYVFSS